MNKHTGYTKSGAVLLAGYVRYDHAPSGVYPRSTTRFDRSLEDRSGRGAKAACACEQDRQTVACPMPTPQRAAEGVSRGRWLHTQVHAKGKAMCSD